MLQKSCISCSGGLRTTCILKNHTYVMLHRLIVNIKN